MRTGVPLQVKIPESHLKWQGESFGMRNSKTVGGFAFPQVESAFVTPQMSDPGAREYDDESSMQQERTPSAAFDQFHALSDEKKIHNHQGVQNVHPPGVIDGAAGGFGP